MFSLVNGLLLRPLYERPDEVVGVYSRSTDPTGQYRGVSYPNYLEVREGATDIFENLTAFSTVFVGLENGVTRRLEKIQSRTACAACIVSEDDRPTRDFIEFQELDQRVPPWLGGGTSGPVQNRLPWPMQAT